MKKYTFLEIANAFRWMHDNTTGKVLLWNFKWFDVVVVKRDEPMALLSKKSASQLAEIERISTDRSREIRGFDYTTS